MIEFVTVTADNLKTLARKTGRPLEDLTAMYRDSLKTNTRVRLAIEDRGAPEGFMHG